LPPGLEIDMATEERPGDGAPSLARKPIVKIDNFVRRQTASVDLETLNQRGVTKINVITYSKINDLISLAVLRAFQKYGRSASGDEAREIGDAARVEVTGTISGGAAGGTASLEDRRKNVEEAVEKLRPMVESRIAELQAEAGGPDPVLLAIRDESLTDLEERVRSAVSRFFDGERSRTLAPTGGTSGEELARLERSIHAAVNRVIDSERSRMLETLERVASARTTLLRRRLEKLKGHLAEMQESLREMAARKDTDPGIPSVYREIQGLSLDDSHYEKKHKMLDLIFEENMKLQKAVSP
jgi:hypothetical protein